MIQKLQEIIRSSPSVTGLLKDLQSQQNMSIHGLQSSLRAFVLSILFEAHPAGILFITHDEEEAEAIRDDLEIIMGKEYVAMIPDQRDRPYEAFYHDTLKKGLYHESLEKIIHRHKVIAVTTASAVSKKVVSLQLIRKQELIINSEHRYDFDILKERLQELGFNREPFVENCGEISIRGGIIDIFPFSRENPLRIEFQGDTVESIREFNVTTQRSIRNISQVIIYPQFPEDHTDQGSMGLVTLMDYFDASSLIFVEESSTVFRQIENKFQDARDQYLLKSDKRDLLPPDALYLSREEFEHKLSASRVIYSDMLIGRQEPPHLFSVRSQESLRGNFKFLKEQIDDLLKKDRAVTGPFNLFFLCESDEQIERFEDIMKDVGIDVDLIQFAVCPLNQGFLFPDVRLAVYTDNQFYGRIRRRFHGKKISGGLSLRHLKSLVSGDFVVHVDHGIGKYVGLKKIFVNKHERECLTIEYQEGDFLYVPLEKMNRVQKYSAKEGVVPQISKLGSSDWEKLKARTKKKVKDIARDLIELYARRKSAKGFAFSGDTSWQKELEASFAFEETIDQRRSVEEIKRDMEAEHPMDRVVCGDVGYGKTEVAIRAAFKALSNNKQVAVLVPTTVLALQHYHTFRDRLKDFPVRVEMLSRFRSAMEQKKIIEWLHQGEIDIVIGTHRLLSKDVGFKDLGLIIIDEEQRFGVGQKEKLKKLKINVDILIMTATPIPRTLNMALMGVKDMSLIVTPPQGRLPIHTDVIPFDKKLIRMAILREVERGGQIFFVHNRVRSIYVIADMLKQLVPEVSFVVAHGQMEEKKLERVMWEFSANRYHCLISTMIIESGLDIPNVNTLIINRSDQFGLSQLYQLRGRVGRSDHRAYAYLIIPPIQQLTKDALKRLRTIEEFTELGAGFRIALRDLEIRGAGNILGGEQSGFMVALGYELYHKILDEAVKELRSEREGHEAPKREKFSEPKIEIDVDAYLPHHYVEPSDERVRLYKTLAELNEISDLDEIEKEMIDRFGPLPSEAKNLLDLVYLKIVGVRLMLKRITMNERGMTAIFHDEIVETEKELLDQRLVSILNKANSPFTFIQHHRKGLGLNLEFKDKQINRLEYSKKFLHSLL